MFKPNQNKTTTKRKKRTKYGDIRKINLPEEGKNRKHDLIKHGNINQKDMVYQKRMRKGNTT